MNIKLKYQLIFIALLAIASYQLAIKKTILLKEEINDLTSKSDSIKMAREGYASLITKRNELENTLGVNNTDSNNVQQTILSLINEECVKNGVSINSVPKIKHTTSENYDVETNIIVLQGNFIALIKAQNFLEQHPEIGNIVSAQYKTEKDLRTNKISLRLTLYIQNFKKQTA